MFKPRYPMMLAFALACWCVFSCTAFAQEKIAPPKKPPTPAPTPAVVVPADGACATGTCATVVRQRTVIRTGFANMSLRRFNLRHPFGGRFRSCG